MRSTITARIAAAALASTIVSTDAVADVGDTMTFSFETLITARLGYFDLVFPTLRYTLDHRATQLAQPLATLVLTETAVGVDFTLTPHYTTTFLNGEVSAVEMRMVYSGDAFTFVDGRGPDLREPVTSEVGTIDRDTYILPSGVGYAQTNVVSFLWFDPVTQQEFVPPATSWSVVGPDVTLSDFGATTSFADSTVLPAVSAFFQPASSSLGGEIGLYRSTVATAVTVTAVPEPATVAMMIFGMLGLSVASKRRAVSVTD